MIDPDKVTAVLLPDGWYDIAPGSFSVAPGWAGYYDPGTQEAAPRAPIAFSFVIGDEAITGPFSSVLAVREPAGG